MSSATSPGPAPAGREISIVVVCWRSAAHLGRLAASIERHVGTGPELVVVENASGEDIGPAARAYGGRVQLIQLETEVGYGAANNAGVAACQGPQVVLMNPDCELRDDGLLALAARAAARRALAGPRLVNLDGSPQPSAGGPPTGVWPWVGALLPGAIQPRRILRRTESWRLQTEAEVGWLVGACIAAPRDLLLELGPFDPQIALYSEDLDLCLRARKAGAASIFCPQLCTVAHEGGASIALAFRPEDSARMMAVNRRAVIRRACGPRAEKLARAAFRLNLGLRALAKRCVGRDASGELRQLRAERQARVAPELPAAPPRGAPPSGSPG